MLYWLLKPLLSPFLRLIFRPWVKGAENVPASGPIIMASNHLSVADSFVLPLVLDRKIVFIGKSDYFTGKGIKGRLTALFMTSVGTIPVDRSGGKASEGALRVGLQVLERGEIFGIYPEGTRSPDARLYRGKTGVARLAIESGAVVIPVAMVDTHKAMPIGKRLPKPMRTGVIFGEPLEFSRYKGMGNDRFILRSVTDEIMYELMKTSGQEYVDVYAATAKARMAAGKPAVRTDELQSGQAPGGRLAPEVATATETDTLPEAGSTAETDSTTETESSTKRETD